MVNIIENN